MSAPARVLTLAARRVEHRLRVSLSQTGWRLLVHSILAICLTWPLLSDAARTNLFRDSQHLQPSDRSAFRSVVEYGELPLWDPYFCGGRSQLAGPQTRFVSPTFLFTLWFGVNRGAALTAFFMLLIGLEGMSRYARSHRGSPVGATLAAALFAANGQIALSQAFDWQGFYTYLLIPWAALGTRDIMRGRTGLGPPLLALSVGWMFGGGGTYSITLAVLVCACEVLAGAWRLRRQPRELFRVGLHLAIAGSLVIGVAMMRLWPLAELHRAVNREMVGWQSVSIRKLWTMVTTTSGWVGGNYRGDSFYMGAVWLPLLFLSLMRRRSRPLWILLALSVWAATGYQYGHSPHTILRELPLFHMLREPARYLLAAGLVSALLVASAFRWLECKARRETWAIAGLGLAVLLASFNLLQIARFFHVAQRSRVLAPELPHEQRDFKQARGNRWIAGYFEAINRGSPSCYDAYPVPMSRLLRGDLPNEEYLADPGAGSVARRSWCPNRIELDVNATRATRLLVNQNYDPGWESSVGKVTSHEHLLAVDLPAGRHHLTLRFLPAPVIGGAIITLLAIGLCGVWWGFRRRIARASPRALAGIWLAGTVLLLVPAPIVKWALPQPRFRAPPPTLPGGEPIVGDRPAAGSIPLGVEFEGGIILEAVQFGAAAGGRQTMDLSWRTTAAVTPGVAVVTHVVVTDRNLTADHVKLGGILRLDEAPLQRSLRDRVLVPRVEGEINEVWVGLWYPLDDQRRVPIKQAGALPVRDQMVRIGRLP